MDAFHPRKHTPGVNTEKKDLIRLFWRTWRNEGGERMNDATLSRKEANVHITHGATNRYEKVQTCSTTQDDYTNLNISVCTECYIRLTMLKIRRQH